MKDGDQQTGKVIDFSAHYYKKRPGNAPDTYLLSLTAETAEEYAKRQIENLGKTPEPSQQDS